MVAQSRGSAMNAATLDESDVDTEGIGIRQYREDKGRNVKKWERAPNPFVMPKEGWPTEAPPGTVEKALVMAVRADREEPLFHPFDSRIEGDIRPLLFYLQKHEEKEAARGCGKSVL